jgi:hypothetical protein
MLFQRNDGASALAVVPLTRPRSSALVSRVGYMLDNSPLQLDTVTSTSSSGADDGAAGDSGAVVGGRGISGSGGGRGGTSSSSSSGNGSGGSAVAGWGFNASRYSLEELDRCAHQHELRAHPDGRIFIHVDSHSMGVGGYDSWSPNVDEAYLVQPHLPPITLRQSTMPSFLAERPREPALQTAIRLMPLYD